MASEQQIKAYIALIAPLCQKYAKKYGYKVCSPAIAQALQESLSSKTSNGLSGLASKYHNHHGLKCGTSWIKAGKPSVNLRTGEEYTKGTITYINDFFRVFNNDESGIEGYYSFLNYSRYANLKACSDPFDYLNKLVSDGYCTSSTYVLNCSNKIKKYNLTQYDNFDAKVVTTAAPTTSEPTYKNGVTYTTQVDLFVRCEPRGEKKLYSELSANAKLHAKKDAEGHGILKKGTKVTCKGINKTNNQTWIKIPSGWVCAINKKDIYIQ